MAFELKQSHWYRGIWRARLSGDAGDVMAMIWRDDTDSIWHLKIRFRYYRDDKFFGSQDERSWRSWHSKTGEDGEGDRMQKILENLLTIGGESGAITDVQFIPCNGDADAMIKILTNPERPGFQSATMTPDQYAEYERTNKLPAGVTPKGDV